MSDPLDAVRVEAGVELGLNRKAAKLLLAGETAEEVEEAARALSEFINSRAPRQEPDPEPADPISAGRREAAERKRRLLAAITGRRAQPRDRQGRFASVSFDGGARQPVPQPPPTHDEWLGEVIARRLADSGARF
jgi:hypothetical protein